MTSFLIIILLVLLAFIIGFALIAKFLLRKLWYFNKPLTYVIVIFLSGWFAYEIHDTFTRPDEYYFKEFEKVTSFPPPASAKIVEETFSFPDFFGDDSSVALYEFSLKDYQFILDKVRNDPKMKIKNHMTGSVEIEEVKGDLSYQDIDYLVYMRPAKIDLTREISFLKDKRRILVYRFSY